ncbi:unnamed protein product [Hydatigera taeniaeformis]|uniref:Pecanex-like protein n=1 Tax=Hydatigena taeniaeformis TaxID=6205 RepID=A0A0R3WTV7_HYDTA|nr:unnamed protein product [Hydatigera taeniaeformis]
MMEDCAIVAIKESPSYNTSRRPTVNGPRGAVAYTMLHRPSSSCAIADNLSLCQGTLSPSESLFSADRVSVTSFNGVNSSTASVAQSRSMQNIHRYLNEDVMPNPMKQLQQLAGTPRTRRSNLYNGESLSPVVLTAHSSGPSLSFIHLPVNSCI